jgi:hypothetical protein
MAKNKTTHTKIAVLGGAIGGLISALISSPQSQVYWWHKEPSNRPNILFWDGIAFFVLFYSLAYFTNKKIFKDIAFGGLILIMLLTIYYSKKGGQNEDKNKV